MEPSGLPAARSEREWTPCVVGPLALKSYFSGLESAAADVAALGLALIRVGQHYAEQAFAHRVPDLSAILFGDGPWSVDLIQPWRDFVVRKEKGPNDAQVVDWLAPPLARALINGSVSAENLTDSFWASAAAGYRNGLLKEGYALEVNDDEDYSDEDDAYVFVKVLCTERLDKLPLVGPVQKPLYCIQPQNNSAWSSWADTLAATELPDKIPNRLVILKTPENSVHRGYVADKWDADLTNDLPPLYTELIGPGDELAVYRWDLYEGDLKHTKIDDLIAKARDKLHGEEEKLTNEAKDAAKSKVSALAGQAVQQIAQGLGGLAGGSLGGAAGAKIGEQAGKLAGDVAGMLVKALIDLALDALADHTFPPVYVTLLTHYNAPQAPFCLASAISGDVLLTLSRVGTIPEPPTEGLIDQPQTDTKGHPTGDNPHTLFDDKPSVFRAQQPPTSRWWFGASMPAPRSTFCMWWARWMPAVAWRDLSQVNAAQSKKLRRQGVSVFSWGGHKYASHGFGVYVRQTVNPAKLFKVANFRREGIYEIALRVDTRYIKQSELDPPPSEPI